jgi:hypothetical protein
MLVNRPSEFVVKFPCNKSKHDRKKANDDRNGQQERLDLAPDIVLWCRWQDVTRPDQVVDNSTDLIQLNRSVNQHSHVVHAQSDDLNGVLQPQ